MSNQAQGSNSEMMPMSQLSKQILYWSTNDNHTKILKNDVPRMENVDVYNGHDQEFTASTSGQSLLLSSAEDIVSFKSKVRIELNPIGSLQELCVTRHFPLPIYSFSDKSLREHNPVFNVECSISIYISSGTASTKKAAKKKAAYEMYKQIEKLASEDVHEVIDNEFENKDASHKIVSSLSHESVTLLKTFFSSINEPKTPHLQFMKNLNNCKLTAADALKKMSERESFTLNCDVIYRNIDKVEVLMQANTTPIVVVSEAGKNENDAQESAAYFILAYLKLKLRI